MRILFYSHDSYGLGHVTRTIAVAERLLRDSRVSSGLILTGAPRAHYFTYPRRCDYVKLPSVTKTADGRYVSREIEMTLPETVRLRGRLILEAALSFQPDVFIADHSPGGLGGEILPTLEALGRAPRTVVRILGMRDILDEPAAVREAWRRDGTLEVLRRCYDLLLVYGQRDFFDPIHEYSMPSEIAAKMVFTGYVDRGGRRRDKAGIKLRFAPRTGRLVVVTVGGGGDGNLLLRSFMQAYEQLGAQAPFEAILVTGPLMSPGKRRRFFDWSARLDGISVLEYCGDMPALYGASDYVVSMGGYNTVCELAQAGARTLIVPRVSPRKEQWIRARRLAERGMVSVLSPEEAVPDRLLRAVMEGLEGPRPPRGWRFDLSGLDGINEAVRVSTGTSRAAPRAGPAVPCVR